MNRSFFRRRAVAAITALAAIAFASNAGAGTIRDDRDDSLYTGLAAQPAFRASGYLRIGSGAVGSGTLIDPSWVLTAGHCVVGQSGNPTANSWSFEVANQTVTIPLENVFVAANYISSGFDLGNYDVALLRLPTPIRGVRPAALYAGTDELGKVITSLGYGTTGNGRTGNAGAAGTRRAGQNVIDAFTATFSIPSYSAQPIVAGNERSILFDFDSPQGTSSTIGSRNALQLEYSGARGDSGGGAFILVNGSVRIIGVVSGGYSPVIDPLRLYESSYGTTAVYTRVSQNLAWIRSAMAGREPSLPTLLASLNQAQMQAASAVAQARVTMAARKGWQLSQFVAPVPGPAEPETPVLIETRAIFERFSSSKPSDCPATSFPGSIREIPVMRRAVP